MPRLLQDNPGPPYEKRGNAVWVGCDSCSTWYPVSPGLLAADAVESICPNCHRAEKLTVNRLSESSGQSKGVKS